MTWQSNLSRIRRFLRDPDANIWADALLKNLFNDSQRDIQMKTNYLDDVQAVRVPPMYDFSYLQEWEWPFLSSTTGNYQALRYHQQAEIVFCHRWEPQAVWGLVEATAPDEGIHFTQPFEAFMGEVPGDIVPLQFPAGFHNAKFVAWDNKPIDFITLKKIQQDDPSWVGRSGEPFAYWRPDKFENQFCLYPVPSSPVWDDIEINVADPDYVYTFAFEDGYLTGQSANWNREDTTNLRQYVFDWELDLGVGTDPAAMRGMWMFEQTDAGVASYGIGMVIHTAALTGGGDFGITIDTGDLMPAGDFGITTDIIESDDNVLFVYSKNPTAVADVTDESDFPDYLQKYIEYGAIERAYAANTDGQIQSLRDYWAMRREMGMKAITRFMSQRKQDRDYRLTVKGVPGFRTRRAPRLPDAYPAVR